jgi:hypothetical protein
MGRNALSVVEDLQHQTFFPTHHQPDPLGLSVLHHVVQRFFRDEEEVAPLLRGELDRGPLRIYFKNEVDAMDIQVLPGMGADIGDQVVKATLVVLQCPDDIAHADDELFRRTSLLAQKWR